MKGGYWTDWLGQRVELRLMKDGNEWQVWGPLQSSDKLGVWIDQIVGKQDEVKRTFYPWTHVMSMRLGSDTPTLVTGWNAR